MYFAFGWPKVLAALEPDSRQEDVVYLFLDQDFFVLVSTSRIQLWTGGQHRVKLGTFTREPDSIQSEGLNKKAFWSSSKRSLAVLTYKNVLHVYGMHSSKEAVLSTNLALGGPDDHLEFKRGDIYLQQSQALSNSGANASDMVGDSRSLLLGFSDGSLQLFSWQAKLRMTLAPFSPKEAQRGIGAPRRPSLSERDRSAAERRPQQPAFHKAGVFAGTRTAQLTRTSSSHSRSSSIERGPMNRQNSDEEKQLQPGIECMDYSPRLHLIAAVLSDGRCAVLRTGTGSLGPGDQIELSHWLCGAGVAATSVRISAAAQLVALGLGSGDVALYRLWGTHGMEPLRLISLSEWGYEAEITGSVADLQWSPDSRALAVGWRRSGLGIWSPAGCRLMCTLRQSGGGQPSLRPQLSGGITPQSSWQGQQGLEGGISVIAWGVQGYRMLVAESSSVAQVMELTIAKRLTNSHRVPQPEDGPITAFRTSQELYFLMADDRLLQISDDVLLSGDIDPSQSGDATAADLVVHHLKPPSQYVSANWPLQHAALSPDGIDIAVAGRRGLALYSRRSARWRLFGDVSQEKELTVHALLWLPRMVLVCAALANSQSAATLLLYPRFHLDNASILASFSLEQIPLAIDVLGAALVVASPPLEIKVLHVNLTGDLTPLGTPIASFQVVRELSIMSVGQPLQDIALVELPSGVFGSPERQTSRPGSAKSRGQRHCVLLRAGGLLSLLDMEQGSEVTLSEDVECFWLSGAAESSASSAAKEAKQLAAALDLTTSFDTAPTRGDIITNITGATPASSVGNSPKAAAAPPGLPVGPSAAGLSNSSSLRPGLESRLDRSQRTISVDSEFSLMRVHSGRDTSTSGREEVEIPWWTYGARGMQLWFPSSLMEPLSPSLESLSRLQDPELEFDKEVYPIGISLAEVAIIGVTQRVLRSAAAPRLGNAGGAHARLPHFQVVPETQPVLPCLLRRLLQQKRDAEALALAVQHANAPHFARSLEWLLFTSLEINADLTPSPNKARPRESVKESPATGKAGPLLTSAAKLLRQFPQFAEIVVNVARKTDAAMWGALFAAVGSPSAILEGLLDSGALQSAACCLVIVDKLEGSSTSYALCLRLIRVTVAEGQYDLTADLLRFIVPPGEDNLLLGLPRIPPAVPEPPVVPEPHQLRPSTPKNTPPQQKGWLGGWFGRGAPPVQQEPIANGHQTTAPKPEEEAKFGSSSHEDRAAWVSAWRLVGFHAWRLLDQGRLRAAARLGRALIDAGASLPALLIACPEGAREGIPSPAACLSALHIAEREFPLASDRECVHDAMLLKEACHAALSYDWIVAMCLLLEDSLVLAEVRSRQPSLWSAFVDLAQNDPRALPYMDVIVAINALPQSSPASL